MSNSDRSSDGPPDEQRYFLEAANIISKKWHPVIIQVLLTADPMGFNDLQTRLETISAKVLTDALEELQENEIVTRRVISESPLRVKYSLTPKGEELQTVIQSLAEWGERHLAEDVGPASVLIADDDRRIANMHAEWLDREYDVQVVFDGDEAIRALGNDIDLAVLDRRMPGRSGDELVDWIRNNHLDCRIIMLTSRDPDTDILSLDFDEYLTKPTNKAEMLDVVESVLDRREYDDLVREYLALRSKQALLRVELSYETREADEEYGRLVTRIEELEEKIGDIPDEALTRFTKEGSK